MANILYGVNGEGAGHSTRAKEVLTHLVAEGHKVHVASFDRGLQNLKDKFDVTEIYGFRFAYVNNRVRYKRTIAKNLITIPHAAKSLSQLNALVDDAKIDLVITDFEPLTCHVGHKRGLPVISIDNQHCLTNAAVSYPKQYRRDAAAAKIVTRLMTPRANAYLVISFFTAPIRKNNTFLFPPLLRQEILRAKPTEGDDVLVYVTSPAPALASLLSSVRCRFVAYGFGREGTEGNIVYKKPSLDGFFADLVSARAVIANSGFSLVTEALHLGKPYLAVPVSHQFEQIFNAYWLEKSGFGAYWEELNRERVESFLYNVPHYRESLAGYPRQGNQALFAKLDTLIADYSKA
ncbi:MAG TPA: glycosyltransferase family protein [Candidatus Dormibacteraeota bacterium]|nr:glycosyltransferase family protein [Candidatus Dormibacteraeota bacterium]